MDPVKEDPNYSTTCIMNSDDLYNKTSFINSDNCENDSIYSILMYTFAQNDNDSFRNLFSDDNYFIFFLQNKDYEVDLVFYALSKFVDFVKSNKIYLKHIENGDIWNYIDIFKQNQSIFRFKGVELNRSTSDDFNNRYCVVSFLLDCLSRLTSVRKTKYSQIGQFVNRYQRVVDELHSQIVSHLCLVTNNWGSDDNKINCHFTCESVLLPFVVANDYRFPIVSEFSVLLYQKYDFNSSMDSLPISNYFYSIFGNVLMNIHHYISKFPVESRCYELLFSALYQLMSVKIADGPVKYPFAFLISKLPTWNIEFLTDAIGKEFERLTFLGPFLSTSMFADDDTEIVTNHFKDDELQEMEITSEQKALQSKLEQIWDLQFKIIKLLLVEKSTHKMTIDYLNQSLFVNKIRGQMQPEESIASGEGFITNVNAVLQRLVAPIKIDRVDVNYLTLNIESTDECNLGKLLADETRIYFDKDSFRKEYQRLLTDLNSTTSQSLIPVNFHTNMFYMSAAAHHYGIIGSIRKQSRRSNAIQSLERSVNEINRLIADNNNQLTSAQIQVHQNTLYRYKSIIHYQKRAVLCSQIVLQNDTFLRCTLEFYVQLTQLLSSLVTSLIPSDNISISSPLTTITSDPANGGISSFSAQPQFLLDDMADFLLFLMSRRPHVFSYLGNTIYDLCSFVLFIVTHSHFVRSPYLVAKFVEIIFSCLPTVTGGNQSSLQSIYRTFCNDYSVRSGLLINRLIRFYIDVEKTGSSNEFYDKFSIRFKISIIFRSLWRNGSGSGGLGLSGGGGGGHSSGRGGNQVGSGCGGEMKIHLLNEVANQSDQFVKFINRAMNDMVYLLDESITSLKRIRTNQEKRNDPRQWSQCSRQEQMAIVHQLTIDERTTKSQLTLADVTVEMLYEFTGEIKMPFLSSELVEKLASMLNSFLLELVGPKCRDLKVSEPDKYNWNPKKLLQNIVRIYLNLDSPTLVEAISNEERYYSSELFSSALAKLDNYNIISKHELEHFDIFRQKIDSLVQQRHIEEAFVDNVPAEYLDPIMSCIMKEPVMLPQSKIIVDMSVIKRHLLNDDCDPFNRQPLKIEDLIPRMFTQFIKPDLQREIQQWKVNSKRN